MAEAIGSILPEHPTGTHYYYLQICTILLITYHVSRAIWKTATRDDSGPPLRVHYSRSDQHDPRKKLDIVAVHGLGADPTYSWSTRVREDWNSPDGISEHGTPRAERDVVTYRKGDRVFWLHDKSFLPAVFPDATIMTFKHSADWIYRAPSSTAESSGRGLLEHLKERLKRNDAPIVLIGHSYGGLVVKAAVSLALRDDEFRIVRDSIVGLIFLGTPHFGSDFASPSARLAGLFGTVLASSDLLLRSMRPEDADLVRLHDDFIRKCEQEGTDMDLWRNSSRFYELRPTMLLGLFSFGRIVGRTSASGGLSESHGAPLDKDHSGLNKFANPKDDAFKQICRAIECHRDGARGQRHRTNIDYPMLFRASKSIIVDLQQGNQRRESHTGELDAFAQSTEFMDWKRIGTASSRREQFLYVKLSAGEPSSLPLAARFLAADLRRPGPGPRPFDMASYLPDPPVGKVLRASEVLRHLLAQVVVPNEVPENNVSLSETDRMIRISTLDVHQRKRLLQALNPSQPLEQTEYWDLLSALIGNAARRPLLLIVDRMDMIDERDRGGFLKELTRVWERCHPGDWLRVLVSSQPCAGELEDNFLRDATVFDPHREFFVGMNEICDAAKNPRQDQVDVGLNDTGHWINYHKAYVKFSNATSSSLICVTGHGGSGKSTLTKRLLETARTRHETPAFKDMTSPMTSRELRPKHQPRGSETRANIVAAFFYQYDANVSEPTKAGTQHINMLCSLLYQIFWQVPSLYPCWKEQLSGKHHPRDWSFKNLQDIFHKLRDSTTAPLSIHIFVDALNESHADFHDSENLPTREKVLNLLDDLRTSSNTMVVWKITLSTRELGQDMICILPHNTIRITEFNCQDVDAVIKDAMQTIHVARQKNQPEFPLWMISEFEAHLVDKAKGVILWIKVVRDMVVGRLRRCELRAVDLKNFVLESSDDMQLLYKRMVRELEHNNQPKVVKAWLQWGTLAIDPLRVSEFKDAVALSDMAPKVNANSPTYESYGQYRYEANREDATRILLVSKCGGFLALRNSTSSPTLSLAMQVQSLEWAEHDLFVEPAHHTATSFLKDGSARPFQILENQAHLDMAEKCVQYLQLLVRHKSTQQNPDASAAAVSYLESLHFLPYVLMNLPRHLASIDETLQSKRSACQKNIGRLFATRTAEPIVSCLLRLWASDLGRSELDQEFWLSCTKATAEEDNLHVKLLTAFVEAAANHVTANAIRSVFAAGLLSEDRVATVPILRVLILSVLSSKDPRMQDGLFSLSPKHEANNHTLRAAYRTILHEALRQNISATGITKLIAAGADVNHRNKPGESPLHVVCSNGDGEISEILLQAGAEVDARNTLDLTPLHMAVSSKHQGIVKKLLDHRANLDARNMHGDTPMSLCRHMKGQEAESIRRLLVAAGASLPSTTTNSKVGWMTVPVRPAKYLVERPEFAKVEHAIGSDSESKQHLNIVAVCGFGGTGKTQIAVQAAMNFYKARPNWSLFWVDGSSESHIQSSCQYLIQLVRPPGYDPQQPPENWETHFLAWLASEKSGHWLLIIDNLDDKPLLVPFTTQLSKGSVLVTSRDSSVLAMQDGPTTRIHGTIIDVGVLARDAALRMLMQRKTDLEMPSTLPGARARSDEHEDLEELVDALCCLPLAITQAAAFMTTNNITVRTYLTLMNRNFGNKKQLLDQEFEEHRGPPDLPNAVLRTLAISFEVIQRVSPSSTRIIAMLGVLDCQGCPEDLLAGVISDKNFKASMQVLHDFSFVRTDEQKIVRTHKLVHEAIGWYLSRQKDLTYWKFQALRLVSEHFPQVAAVGDWSASRALLPHAETVLEYARQLLPQPESDSVSALEDPNNWRLDLLSAVSMYQSEINALQRSKSLLEEARQVAGIMQLTDTERDLELQSNLSVVLSRLGHVAKAERFEQRALERRKSLPNVRKDDIVKSMANLASLQRAGGKLHEAKILAIEVLEIRRALETGQDSESNRSATQTAMLDLAAVHIGLGELKSAEFLQRRVTKARLRSLGSGHPSTIRVRNELATTYGMQGRYDEAERVLDSVIAETAPAHGPAQHDHDWHGEAISHNRSAQYDSSWSSTANLAVVYRGQKRWAEAESLDRRLLGVVPAAHPISLFLKQNLSVTLREWGRETKDREKLSEALDLIVEVVQARTSTLGPEAPGTLEALLLEAQSRWYLDEAEPAKRMIEDIYLIRSRTWGPKHPDTLSTLLTLASVIGETEQKREQEVNSMLRSILEDREKVLGETHPDTVTLRDRLLRSDYFMDMDDWSHTRYRSINSYGHARLHAGNTYGDSYFSVGDSSTLHFGGRREF